jgi:hypothetical protein
MKIVTIFSIGALTALSLQCMEQDKKEIKVVDKVQLVIGLKKRIERGIQEPDGDFAMAFYRYCRNTKIELTNQDADNAFALDVYQYCKETGIKTPNRWIEKKYNPTITITAEKRDHICNKEFKENLFSEFFNESGYDAQVKEANFKCNLLFNETANSIHFTINLKRADTTNSDK